MSPITTVIAVETKRGVIFGSDTQATMGHTKMHLNTSKFFKTGDYVIGLAGMADMIKVLQQAELPAPEGDLDQFMDVVFTKVAEDLQDSLFEKFGVPLEEGRHNYASSLIVGVRGQVFPFRIGQNIYRDASGIATIGSGGEYAAAAMRGRTKTEKNVLVALQSASEVDIYTSAPFHVKTFR